MEVNQLPAYDPTNNPTGCCPRFDPTAWDDLELRFEHKRFVRASTVSLFHVPLNMGAVYARTWEAIQHAHADSGAFLVLTHEDSAWGAEHLFAVDREVPGAEMVELSGTFITRVFDGPYREAPAWGEQMHELARDCGWRVETLYFFYTTCPKCAKVYGHNYVVGVARVAATPGHPAH